MSSQDLTSLAALKNWLGLPANVSPNDASLSGLVTAASRAIYALLSRPALLPQTYVDAYDLEAHRVFLRQWPVLAINSVTLDGRPVPAASSSLGYSLRPGDYQPPGAPQALDLFHQPIERRRQNLFVNYTAGYAIQNEAQTAPTSAPWMLNAAAPYGPWASDLGVVYAASGAALTAVAGAPS